MRPSGQEVALATRSALRDGREEKGRVQGLQLRRRERSPCLLFEVFREWGEGVLGERGEGEEREERGD